MAKLKKEDKVEIGYLYGKLGWRPMHLARKYNIAHSTVLYHVSRIQREVEPIDYCPDEIVEKSAHVQSWKRNRPRYHKSFEEYLLDEEERRIKKQASCTHKRLVVICLDCKDHLEETRTHKARVEVTFL